MYDALSFQIKLNIGVHPAQEIVTGFVVSIFLMLHLGSVTSVPIGAEPIYVIVPTVSIFTILALSRCSDMKFHIFYYNIIEISPSLAMSPHLLTVLASWASCVGVSHQLPPHPLVSVLSIYSHTTWASVS